MTDNPTPESRRARRAATALVRFEIGATLALACAVSLAYHWDIRWCLFVAGQWICVWAIVDLTRAANEDEDVKGR